MKGLIADQTQRVPREAGSSWDGKIRRVLQAPNESGGHVQQYPLQNKAATCCWHQLDKGFIWGVHRGPPLECQRAGCQLFQKIDLPEVAMTPSLQTVHGPQGLNKPG